MVDQRRSYWKTTAAAIVAAAVSGAAATWAAASWHPASSALVSIAGIGTIIVATIVGLWAIVVVAGGFIALRRDALEEEGIPYAPLEPREWHAGPLVRRLRAGARAVRALLRPNAERLDLRAGELVEVRSLAEIRRTLDDRGALDGVMFMPEMAGACGRRFRVYRRLDKLNDWIGHTGLRRMRDTVYLAGARCDGSGHAGCQAACYLRWKESWLRRVADDPPTAPGGARDADAPGIDAPADLQRLARRTAGDGSELFVCQATELSAGTTPLRRADPRHYVRDLVTGNIALRPLLTGVAILAFNTVQRRRRGVTYPCLDLPDRKTSPHLALDLTPGELVRVRSKREIEETLNSGSRNRGLWFDPEMVRFCGGEYRVAARVDRLVDERTGRFQIVNTPCIVLDGVAASGEYLGFCAQNEVILWREIWLARVAAAASAAGTGVTALTSARSPSP